MQPRFGTGTQPCFGSREIAQDFLSCAKEWGVLAWKKFTEFQPVEGRALSNFVFDTRWVFARKMVDEQKDAQDRLVAKGDLVETSGRASLRFSHLASSPWAF